MHRCRHGSYAKIQRGSLRSGRLRAAEHADVSGGNDDRFACTVGGKPATAHSVVSGSFDSAYTMTVTAESPELPGGKIVMWMDAKWLGPCAADQKPGDIVLSNGSRMNILDIRKYAAPAPEPR
jgi:hypothetical protein